MIRKNKKEQIKHLILFIVLVIVASLFVTPVVLVFMNSFKSNVSIGNSMFSLPTKFSFVWFDNYIKGFTFGAYSFWLAFFYSALITISSVLLILLCTSMAAWFIVRVNNKITKII